MSTGRLYEKYSEIPVIVVGLKESKGFVEKEILKLTDLTKIKRFAIINVN